MKRFYVLPITLLFAAIMCTACGNGSVVETASSVSDTVPLVTESSIAEETFITEETTTEYTGIPTIESSVTDDILFGTWRYEDLEEGMVYRYIFYEDGTGFYTMSDGSQALAFNMTYTVNGDGTVSILFDNTLTIENYSYSVSNDVLTMVDANGVSVDYQVEEDASLVPNETSETI